MEVGIDFIRECVFYPVNVLNMPIDKRNELEQAGFSLDADLEYLNLNDLDIDRFGVSQYAEYDWDEDCDEYALQEEIIESVGKYDKYRCSDDMSNLYTLHTLCLKLFADYVDKDISLICDNIDNGIVRCLKVKNGLKTSETFYIIGESDDISTDEILSM